MLRCGSDYGWWLRMPLNSARQAEPSPALPVAVIGAGPVGLAAAAHLVREGLRPIVLEAGPTVGSSVLEWGHVRLFSPWRYNIDAAAADLLAMRGWTPPDLDELPRGQDLVDRYLEPLGHVPELRGHIHTSTRVAEVTRFGTDKVRHDRAHAPFLLRVLTSDGERNILAAAVIDASGTWAQPNPLGGHGIAALGETGLRDRLTYGIPDIKSEPKRFAGKAVAVVGSGHSAANTILDLTALKEVHPKTDIHWVVRSDTPRAYGGGDADELPARGALSTGTRGAVHSGRVHLHRHFAVEEVLVVEASRRLRLVSSSGEILDGLDEVIVATGQRPDLSLTSELRLDLDLALESCRELGPLIDPNLHSCGTVRPHSYAHLTHAEPGFFTAGAKSYGRAPTFLMATGYEQVRSIGAHLAGDEKRARSVHLVLPESGVCGTATGSGCCSAELAGAGAGTACCA